MNELLKEIKIIALYKYLHPYELLWNLQLYCSVKVCRIKVNKSYLFINTHSSMYNSLRLYIGVPHMKSNMMDRVPLHPPGGVHKKV